MSPIDAALEPDGKSERPVPEASVHPGAQGQTERLMRITAAIADAVTEEQVLHAVVDEVAAALGASSIGLWLVEAGGTRANLKRSVGYRSDSRPVMESVPLDAAGRIPIVDAMRTGRPLFLESQAELIERYPHLQVVVTPGRRYRIGCLPIISREGVMGGLGLTFDNAPPAGREQRDLLMMVTRYAGQALERLRLYVDNQQGRLRAELLYGLVRKVIEARTLDEVFDSALDAIGRALLTARCSILIGDEQGIMRFRAWRGLSAAYRAAVDGHSPWRRDDPDPQAILVSDVSCEASLAAYRPLFEAERIGSLGFFPLVAGGHLLGKFMVYYEEPRVFGDQEIEMAKAIANHVAAACARFGSLAELEKTVRFHEMFTGIVGHDLRNPLAAILAAAELAQCRGDGDGASRPLQRIITSGKRMGRMIDQLLDLTRVRMGGGMPLHPKPADLIPVVRQVTDELVHAHPDRRFVLEEQGRGEGAWDVDRLSQVFSNLVGNAAHHGDGDFPVRIRIDGSAADEIRFDVHNHGVIPSDGLARLFEPLGGRQADRQDGAQGLGLGLFISAQIVQAHGGRIDVRSAQGEGTVFSVTLPRQGL